MIISSCIRVAAHAFFILSDAWVAFHCILTPHLLYPFICWWTFMLLPCLGYSKQCCYEHSVQFGWSVVSDFCDPRNHSTPGLPVHYQLLELTQTHVHWVGDVIQPSYLLSSPSPPAPICSQHQGLFQWVNPLHDVAKVLEFQLQHQTSTLPLLLISPVTLDKPITPSSLGSSHWTPKDYFKI